MSLVHWPPICPCLGFVQRRVDGTCPNVYGVFTKSGRARGALCCRERAGQQGRTLDQAAIQPRQVVSRETAYLITNMMEDVIQRERAWRQNLSSTGRWQENRNHERLHRRLVYRPTPNLATGAWVGFDDRRPLGETESGRTRPSLFGLPS